MPTRINYTLTAAIKEAGSVTGASRRLLEALSANEKDSALGLLADAILRAGPFSLRADFSEWESAERAAHDIEHHATTLAEGYRNTAIFSQEQST